MKRKLMVIGYEPALEQKVKEKWFSEEFYLYHVENLRKVSEELDGSFRYSLVLILGEVNVMEAVRAVRRISKVPILVVRKRYDGVEKIAVLETGADEYIQYPEKREEGIASIRALIRRYTEWNPCHGYIGCRPSEDGLCIIPEYRRVFTYEQLFYLVWREEGIFAESCMHSCINRIRRKLESVPNFSAKIENVRGVGYRYRERNEMEGK